LIKGKKFDIRAYMVIICAKPYLVYSHAGYARLSLIEYTTDNYGAKSQPLKDGEEKPVI